jgi:hypothetical protein
MDGIDYDVETCSEVYKQYIRSAKYGDIVSNTTKENIIFIYKEKKFILKFTLDFSFDFNNGFNHTNFYDFSYNRKVNDDEKKEFERYVNHNFVTEDRLSC